jgi:hypothetical protein
LMRNSMNTATSCRVSVMQEIGFTERNRFLVVLR